MSIIRALKFFGYFINLQIILMYGSIGRFELRRQTSLRNSNQTKGEGQALFRHC